MALTLFLGQKGVPFTPENKVIVKELGQLVFGDVCKW
jgi:hypothetical protein